MSEAKTRRTRAEVRILLVNDNPQDRELEYRALIKLGYFKPSEARDGVEALDYLGKDGQTDLVLMDTKMPRVDGIEACKEMRKQPYGQRIAIIGTSDGKRAHDWRAAGADGFFTRNYELANPSRLDAAIQEALKRRQNLELVL